MRAIRRVLPDGGKLPDDFGQVTVMSEDRLTELQDGVVLLDRMMWGLAQCSPCSCGPSPR
ncbi:MAG: hypothetical protein WD895_06485 [Acidimicrobiia bacterium]